MRKEILEQINRSIERGISETLGFATTTAAVQSTLTVEKLEASMRAVEGMMKQLEPMPHFSQIYESALLPTFKPLKWGEKILLWNPCNDFVDTSPIHGYMVQLDPDSPERMLIVSPVTARQMLSDYGSA